MKKRSLKITTAIMAVVLVLGTLCACTGGKSSYAGTWYNATNIDDRDTIILTKEGTFSYDGYGGEYSVEENQMILVASVGSAVLNIGKTDGNTSLTDEDGNIWLKGEADAKAYYEKESNKKIQEAEAAGDLSGGYGCCVYYSGEEIISDGKYLKLNADKTYEYKYEGVYSTIMGTDRSDCWQKGTWSIGVKGSLNADSVRIILTPSESGGYDEIGSGEWIEENTLPSELKNIKYYYQSEKKQGKLYFETNTYWKKAN